MVLRALLLLAVWFFVACGGAGPQDESTPKDPPPTIKEGEKLLEQGEFEQALETFKRIVESEPSNAQGHYYLALASKNLGDIEGAEEHYRLAIGYDGKLSAAHNNLGLLLLEKGDLVHAETELNTYLKQIPDNASANYNYGLVLEAMDKLSDAQKYYEKSAELDPKDPSVWIALGDLSRAQGDLKGALKKYKKGLEFAVGSPDLTLKEGQTLLDLKRLDDAVKVLTGLSTNSECPPEIMATAGILLAKYDEDDKAIELYLAAISKDDDYAVAHLLAANALARKKKFAEAATHYEAFLRISPEAEQAPAAKERLEACKAQLK